MASRTCVSIERLTPRDGVPESPYRGKRGYKIGDPKFGEDKHLSANAFWVPTLDQAAELVERGFHLWMVQAGKRPSLICPESLRVVWR